MLNLCVDRFFMLSSTPIIIILNCEGEGGQSRKRFDTMMRCQKMAFSVESSCFYFIVCLLSQPVVCDFFFRRITVPAKWSDGEKRSGRRGDKPREFGAWRSEGKREKGNLFAFPPPHQPVDRLVSCLYYTQHGTCETELFSLFMVFDCKLNQQRPPTHAAEHETVNHDFNHRAAFSPATDCQHSTKETIDDNTLPPKKAFQSE
jgi:hypothetical protein